MLIMLRNCSRTHPIMPEDAGSNLLHDWIARAALAAPDKTWVVSADDGRTVSYGQLRETVGRFATFLRAARPRPQRSRRAARQQLDRAIALLFRRHGQRRDALHHPRRDEPQPARQYFRAAKAEAHSVSGRLAARRSVWPQRPRRGCGSGARTRPSRTRCSPSWRVARRAIRRRAARPDDDAIILFTSGTSAQPKGVVLNFREYLLNIDPLAAGWGITAADRLYDFRPFSWNSAQTLGALTIVNRGATLVLAEKFSASRFFQHLRDHGVTIAAGNPTTINILLNSEQTRASRQPAKTALHHLELGAAAGRGMEAVRAEIRHSGRAGLRRQRGELDRRHSRRTAPPRHRRQAVGLS